jgi:hypothetical protein
MPIAANEHVCSWSTDQRVVPGAANEPVMPIAAVQGIIAIQTEDEVAVTGRGREGVHTVMVDPDDIEAPPPERLHPPPSRRLGMPETVPGAVVRHRDGRDHQL